MTDLAQSLAGFLRQYAYVLIFIIPLVFNAVWGRMKQSEKVMRLAVAIFPKSADAHYRLGRFLATQPAFFGEAEQELRLAISLKPRFFYAYLTLYSFLSEREDRKAEADTFWGEVVQLFPNEPIAFGMMGDIYKEKKMLAEAEQSYQQAIALAPRFAPAHQALAVVFAEQETRLAEAEESIRQAVKHDYKNRKFRYQLAAILYRAKKYVDAEKEARSLISSDARDPLPYYLLGVLFTEQDRYAEAEKILKQAFAQVPDNKDVLPLLLSTLQKNGKAAEAIHVAQEAVRLRPHNVAAYLHLAHILHSQEQRYDEAEKVLQKVLLLEPGNKTALYNIACAKSRLHQTDAAFEYLQKAIENDANKASAWNDPDFEPIRSDPRFLEIVGPQPVKQ